jgi:DNA-binding HxlR family transcriptional regulator
MLPRTYDSQTCSMVRALEIVGERWTLLILRDAFLGIRRFEDFQGRLGTSRTVLAGRLAQLVEQGLFARVRYQHHPDRFEYRLTEKGCDVWPAIEALVEWGDRYASPAGPPREFLHAGCGTPVTVGVRCPHCRTDVAPSDIVTGPGPGADREGSADLPVPLRVAREGRRPLLEPVRVSAAT